MMVSMNVQTNIKTESARTQSNSHFGLWYGVKHEESMSVCMHSIYYYMDGIFKSVDRCTGLTPNAGHILKVRDQQCVWAEGSEDQETFWFSAIKSVKPGTWREASEQKVWSDMKVFLKL